MSHNPGQLSRLAFLLGILMLTQLSAAQVTDHRTLSGIARNGSPAQLAPVYRRDNIICVPIRVFQPDPMDPTKTYEVEQLVCSET